MKVTKTSLSECFIIEPTIIGDERGYFYESFHQKKFEDLTGLKVNFVQDNQSLSRKGTLRGLHFQRDDYAQAKLVQVLRGTVLDVVVDLREGSKTFGKHFSIELSSENKKQLFIPRGFAHGFVVLSAEAEFFYKCDNYYHKDAESGIMYNDPDLGIDWELPQRELIISDKDLHLPSFSAL
ncbi:dTDP-4-dehydrorhamnose 3,5-epimerase [Urechidicola vernalis]|uniref:dTDP-4-dehydrorhamnose 3,5-epimerase n=1 Tax=Urechidicola vernalis TaxID=3075600 RepID=A0ABU2Y7G7_9FLAO|nr:dTDP-4-dehydrorhamnose 3,5-epimerase [Urechidicola sp. P050]MDT0554131.1 dTDP-4-dehydrorhamnose 3,5-epimerase [Urechidicola sp. P050]